MKLRYLTAGESHGRGLVGIIEGLPAGLPLTAEDINRELARRQRGFGRGGRMRIEHDRVELLAGVRHGRTLGGPVGLVLYNRDWENWRTVMNPDPPATTAAGTRPAEARTQQLTRPRPGHADLAGGLKYRHLADLRNVLERASARETAMRVALGAVARCLLRQLDIQIYGHVVQIGPAKVEPFEPGELAARLGYAALRARSEASEVRCAVPETEQEMLAAIDQAQRTGDSLGGVFEVIVTGVPVGVGSHVHWDRKLDGQLAWALMSIQAIKGVEVGLGFAAAGRKGSQVHDEIFYCLERGFYRRTNRAGGIEGGIANGEPIVIRAAMKPIPTLRQPLQSVDVQTKEPLTAAVERSDVCAVPAAAVVGENVVAHVVAAAILEKFGGDHLEELRANFQAYLRYLEAQNS